MTQEKNKLLSDRITKFKEEKTEKEQAKLEMLKQREVQQRKKLKGMYDEVEALYENFKY